jgi:hypothetical protein
MNLKVLEPLQANGTDQAVEVPRHYGLMVRSASEVELRDTPGGNVFVLPADTPVWLGPFLGQTVYVRAVAGATVYLALI